MTNPVPSVTIRPATERENELLEANTRYLLRARTSEHLLVRAADCMALICSEDIKLHEEIQQHLKAPWFIDAASG
jgi:hypothetical protein